MSAIKKFFQKKKLDHKFKKAGDGHKLTEDTRSAGSGQQSAHSNAGSYTQRSGPSSEAAQAAEAALMRMQQSQNKPDATQIAKARLRRELEEERKAEENAMKMSAAYFGPPKEVVKDSAPVLSTILYTCPEIGPAVLPKAEMEGYIHEFLLSQLSEEPEMTSALMIQTLNKNTEKVKVCVETLSKYLDNLIKSPGEEKFRKIRLNNKAFKERVSELNGTDEFLQAVGFSIGKLPFEDHEEDFYFITEEKAEDTSRLESLKEVLLAAEPIKPQLDRALKVFHPTQSASRFNIPNEFYTVSPEELKKEQQRRQEASEKLGMLRTKAMRERDEMRELRKYRFVLIRVKLPDSVILQGTFKAHEKLSDLFSFIREHLVNDWMPFQIISAGGQKLTEEELTFAELGLAPAALVNFSFDKTVMADVVAQQGANQNSNVLKSEIMAQIQDM